MYKVYCDGNIIYDPRLPDRKIFNAIADLELNKTGSFNFAIYPTHKKFDSLRQMKSVIKVTQDDDILFRGRILDVEQGFYNEKQVACEGELAFLLDSVIEPEGSDDSPVEYKPLDYLNKLISKHNELMTGCNEKHFTVGNISDALKDKEVLVAESDYKTPWELITENLIDVLGGYIWVRHVGEKSYIDYLTEPDVPSNQAIKFGKNLLDLKKTIKGADIATGIIPISKGSNDDDIVGDYILTDNADAIAALGIIYKVVEFEDVKDKDELNEKAKEYLNDTIKLTTTVELTAADLAGIEENTNPFKLGQKLAVRDDYHGLYELADKSGTEALFLVKKISIDILNPSNNKLTVGATFSTFTEKQSASVSSQNKTAQTVSKIEKQASSFLTVKDLEGYYKKTDADNTFATKEELNNGLSGQSKALTDYTTANDATIEELRQTITALTERVAALENTN